MRTRRSDLAGANRRHGPALARIKIHMHLLARSGARQAIVPAVAATSADFTVNGPFRQLVPTRTIRRQPRISRGREIEHGDCSPCSIHLRIEIDLLGAVVFRGLASSTPGRPLLRSASPPGIRPGVHQRSRRSSTRMAGSASSVVGGCSARLAAATAMFASSSALRSARLPKRASNPIPPGSACR